MKKTMVITVTEEVKDEEGMFIMDSLKRLHRNRKEALEIELQRDKILLRHLDDVL